MGGRRLLTRAMITAIIPFFVRETPAGISASPLRYRHIPLLGAPESAHRRDACLLHQRVCVCDPRDAAVTCSARRSCHSCDVFCTEPFNTFGLTRGEGGCWPQRTAQWFRWLGSRIHSCATPFESRRAPARFVLSGRWPVPLVGSRLESRSAALGGFSATTTSTIKRRCAVSRSVFVWEVCRCPGCFLCRCVLCACDPSNDHGYDSVLLYRAV